MGDNHTARRLNYPSHRMLLALLLALASTMYFLRLGRAGFDDAEAYSAYIASRKTVADVFDASLQLDPGKGGGLYVFLLHWYCGVFGTGEAALRAFSAMFGVVGVMLVYALAAELFDTEIALVAATLWAFNPIALIVARWARMYSMFIALTIASLLALRKLQNHPTRLRVAAFAALGAAMLYTHLGAALMLGGEAAILARERWRGREIAPGGVGIALAMMLFVPIAPFSLAQIHDSALGHRFDWIGTPHPEIVTLQMIGAAMALICALAIVFGPPLPCGHHGANMLDDSEPMRWCALWTILPMLALLTGSLIFHPMFEIRYIAPVVAGFAIVAAALLDLIDARVRDLVGIAIASAFLVIAILFNVYHAPFDLWRRIARVVETGGSSSQEIFFEAGYVMSVRQAGGLDPDSMVKVLPLGYLRIPFDYYFKGSNLRRALNPFRPSIAREMISESARRSGGAWLVSHMNDDDLKNELPSPDEFVDQRIIYDESVSVSLYHIVTRRIR